MLLLSESEIHTLLTPSEALEAMRSSFIAHDRGAVEKPDVITLEFDEHGADVHAKGSYIHGDPTWAVKVASSFPGNNRSGEPVHSGLSLVFSSSSGYLEAILLDNGYLTELRTGATGALATDLLSRADASTVAVIGAGSQARFQLDALLRVRKIDTVRVLSRRRAHAERYALDARTRYGVTVQVCDSGEEAVAGADIVVTTTPSREPVVEGAWLEPGTHLTAIGCDSPGKRELDAECLRRAAVVVVDDPDQAITHGELQHAARDGSWDVSRTVALGALLQGKARGRLDDRGITIADLSGVGSQDAAIASLAYSKAVARGIGRRIAEARFPEETK
ncbi:ornithine cyclodeaminase family protein [Actinomadura luteofluorescens]|uniref:Ornithine cyclodeaminase n=2 Tax=Actinomadura luteofluorescens TaxID=46163 RepID=A0A7Y9ECF6_9ACTN|nr:ornithine cyclodeaminase [Actinomadura luteofluorescens]